MQRLDTIQSRDQRTNHITRGIAIATDYCLRSLARNRPISKFRHVRMHVSLYFATIISRDVLDIMLCFFLLFGEKTGLLKHCSMSSLVIFTACFLFFLYITQCCAVVIDTVRLEHYKQVTQCCAHSAHSVCLIIVLLPKIISEK